MSVLRFVVIPQMRDETVVKWQPLGQQQSPSQPGKLEERGETPDLSPPRSGRSRAARELSPDLSPPRGRRGRHDSPDTSPPLRTGSVATGGRKGHKLNQKGKHYVTDSDRPPDLAPPTEQRHDSPDISLPRRARRDSPDSSPPRIRSQCAPSPDLCPPRARRRHDSPDMSPPRRVRHDSPEKVYVQG